MVSGPHRNEHYKVKAALSYYLYDCTAVTFTRNSPHESYSEIMESLTEIEGKS